MQMMFDEPKSTKTVAAQKKWLRKAAMETFNSKELEIMANQKRKKETENSTEYGIAYGLPKDYGSDF